MITIAIDPGDPRLMARVKPAGLHLRLLHQPRIYRFYDASGGLLYLGITAYFPERWTAHRRTADWWPLVDHVTVGDPYPHQAAAEDAEREAIRSEQPRFNRRSTPEYRRWLSESTRHRLTERSVRTP